MIVFRKKDEWLMEVVEKIVQTKNDMGIRPPTSFSYELIRLAKSQLLANAEGADTDRAILEMLKEYRHDDHEDDGRDVPGSD